MTLLHSRKYYEIPELERPELSRSGVRLKMVKRELIHNMGQVNFSIKINNRCNSQRFLVAEIDAPAVLGYDFLY